MIRSISIVALGLWVAMAGVASAQSAEDEAMTRRVRRLGTAIGKAYVCTPEKGQEDFNEEAHHLFDLIVQDVGSDFAFTYAVGLGRGASVPKENADCAKTLKQWEEIREDYELKGDG